MISHNRPYLNDEDKKALIEVIDSNFIAQGEKVKQFEKAIVSYLGKKGYSCAVSSGTSALYLALYALNIKNGDEVILPTYVCSAVLNAIYMRQASPVLVDINAGDFNISFDEAKKVITSKTKAIIIPHMYGVPADLDSFKSLGVPIIEDCAQAIGAKYKGERVGTIGDIAIFSFYATKFLTTGHGGMVYSLSKKLIDKIKDYVDFDYRRSYYPRFNFQMSDLQAALGLSQLAKLDFFLKRREEIALKYQNFFKNKNIKWQNILVDGKRVFYRFVIKVKKARELKKVLEKEGVQTIIPIENWELLHRYLKQEPARFPVAEEISRSTLSIPIYPSLKDSEVDYILKTLKKALAYDWQ